jgi:hypothetical protein
MKRAVHAFFWFSVVVAIAAVITRQGKKPQPTPEVEAPAPKVALDPKPTLEPVRPALPPTGRLDAAAPAPSTVPTGTSP